MKEKFYKLYYRINQFANKHKKHLRVILVACVFAIAVILAIPKITTNLPYEIKVDNNVICYVKNETVAQEVIKEVYKTYLPKRAKLIKVSSNVKIASERANIFKAFSNIDTKETAVQTLKTFSKIQKDKDVKLEATYILMHKEDYIPEPKLKKNKKMLAGRVKIVKKGQVGKMDVSTVFVSVNGKIKSKEDINTKVIDKGIPAVLYKGILGLPDGENWKTYEGDPIYKDGEDLIKTAYNYIGAPYKHGGTSLKTGVSCVGFVRAIYLKYGIKIGNSHSAMEHAGIGVSYKNARKGDIICYKGHVGLYIGNGKMLDATSSRGVGVNKVNPKSIIAVRRIVKK